MNQDHQISRRTFVSTTAASVVATAASAGRVLGANNRLRVGIIGCGGLAQGSHIPSLLRMKETDNVEIVTVCDVYQKRLDQAAKTTSAKPIKDYRALLDQKDIDYVAIVTPEHWHAKMTLDAADAGKHIYCEKPMTWSIEEAKKVVAKINQTKVKMQVGVQGMSDDSYETAQRMIKEGKIGRPIQAQIDYSRNHKRDFWVSEELDKDVRPGENLDWNAFLGPAPKRPFDLDRFLHWRRYWDYSGGIATDLFVHRVTRIIRALDLKFPDRVVATGGKWEFRQSAAEIPDTFNMMLDYPEGLTVVVLSSMANAEPIPHVIRGHEATLQFTRDGFEIRPEGRMNRAGDKETITHKKTGGEDILLHHRNLQAAIRDGAAIKTDVMTGYYGVVAVRLATESFRRSKYMKWDAKRERGVPA
ncbi:MAG TPA: Gfo/Idh/MocA family oxidoreductase [Blastocatellia bacterium]|nr:Gfo/Idh/MocA family oxidoreductase [Blastocatellia bacterium]HMX27388.1 Gfo/Idh/MocA family oxidoreductase [Blastocatellia bacterium]HMY74790.1 Gfo/Idh/MocA family oxidoreductase [Blastocatellia bacterium]HMZ20838.1 Gfo/Idh/MocA family oxidoreductase [Blastocatellia bacterium]HNG29040.1 Gfo/Idh/MocA family oxidoreductase [Blastocatellia bacterium]